MPNKDIFNTHKTALTLLLNQVCTELYKNFPAKISASWKTLQKEEANFVISVFNE